jgi:cellulase/cellobiase CelA1
MFSKIFKILFFLARMDRYNHDIGDDTDETEESPLFSSFSSYSPQYRKQHPNRLSSATFVNQMKSTQGVCEKIEIDETASSNSKTQTVLSGIIDSNLSADVSNMFLKNNCALTPGLRKLNVCHSIQKSFVVYMIFFFFLS